VGLSGTTVAGTIVTAIDRTVGPGSRTSGPPLDNRFWYWIVYSTTCSTWRAVSQSRGGQ